MIEIKFVRTFVRPLWVYCATLLLALSASNVFSVFAWSEFPLKCAHCVCFYEPHFPVRRKSLNNFFVQTQRA